MSRDNKILIFAIDSAIAMSDANIDELYDESNEEPKIHFTDNSEYKYLMFAPVFEDGTWAPLCSKDMDEWALCVRATKDGEDLDLMTMQAHVANNRIKGVIYDSTEEG